MSLKVASYLMGIPPGNTNPEKPAIIVNFIEGVWKCGDEGTIVTDYDPVDCDVAVVQGYVHENSKKTPHLMLRKNVFDYQQKTNNRSIIVDSNLFLYADPENKHKFLRYSYDGIFPTTGEYCNDNPDPKRWEIIKSKLDIDIKPYKTSGEYILLCCQRDGGWSMGGQDLMPWLVRTIKNIQQYSDRKIVVRFHPGDKKIQEHKRLLVRHRLKDVLLSSSKDIRTDFKNSYAVVSYNSSPGVAAAIEGIPLFLLDPENSQAKDVGHTSLAHLEKPRHFDRESWIHKMAQMHWTLDELKDGTAWQHLRKYAKK